MPGSTRRSPPPGSSAPAKSSSRTCGLGDRAPRPDRRRPRVDEGGRPGDGVRGRHLRGPRRAAPDRVLDPLATDVERAWILLPDGGPRWATDWRGPAARALAAAIADYGRLQRRLEPHVDELLAAGVADMRPAVMPGASRRRVEPSARPEATRIAACERRVRPVVRAARGVARCPPASTTTTCTRATSSAVRPTSASTTGATPSSPTRSRHARAARLRRADRAGSPTRGPARPRRLPRGFTDLAPHAELVETLELACRVARSAGLTWERALRACPRTGRIHRCRSSSRTRRSRRSPRSSTSPGWAAAELAWPRSPPPSTPRSTSPSPGRSRTR